MIAFLTLLYVGVLGLLVLLKVLPNKPGTWMSTIVWVVVLFLALFVPMQWGAPSGPARIMVPTIQIVPNVSGPVVEVPVQPNTPIQKGQILFKIDPVPYEADLAAKRAALAFEELRLEQFSQLAERNAGTRFQVEQTEAQVDKLRADVEAAEWNLRETVVRAPSDGYVTNLALRPGQRVTNLPLQPAMTFFNSSELITVTQINQIYLRHLKRGQPVEIAFKKFPGRIFNGTVHSLIQVTSASQSVISGTVPPATQIVADPFFVRIELEDDDSIALLSPGAVGTAAVYTDSVTATHIIRKVMIRMESIMNYVVPWL